MSDHNNTVTLDDRPTPETSDDHKPATVDADEWPAERRCFEACSTFRGSKKASKRAMMM